MISTDFNSQLSFPLCYGVGCQKFWKGWSQELEIFESQDFGKVRVGVAYFTSNSATLVRT